MSTEAAELGAKGIPPLDGEMKGNDESVVCVDAKEKQFNLIKKEARQEQVEICVLYNCSIAPVPARTCTVLAVPMIPDTGDICTVDIQVFKLYSYLIKFQG